MRTGYMLMFVLLVMCATALLVAEEGDAERALDVNLTLNEPSAVKVATLREQVQFNFTIEHNGSANSEEVVIDILNPYSLWNIFLSADPRSGTAIGTNSLDFTLDKDEAANLTVTLTFADSTLNGTYWFTVLAYPKLAPQNNDSYLIGVIVGQWVGFELVLWDPPPDDTYEAIPPSRALITYALYNTGNGDDRFLITGSSSRFDEGWTLTYILGIDDYGHTESLPPDPGRANPHFISISVDVPAGTLADQTSMVYLNCTSVFDASIKNPPVMATVKARQFFNFQVYINGVDSKDGIPGETVDFEIKINNRGNGPDTISLEGLFDEVLNPGFVAFADPSNITIEPNEYGTALMVVEIPEDAPKDTYLFTVEVASESDMLAPVTKSLVVEVGQFWGIELTGDNTTRETVPGGNLEFEVEVRNSGNGLDSILIQDIFGAPDAWLTYMQPPEVTLLQNQTAVIKLIVIVPSKFEETPKLGYTLTLRAESSRSAAEASLDLVVNITPFNLIDWTYQGERLTAPERPRAPPGGVRPRPEIDLYSTTSVMLTLGVENFGNIPDEVELDVEAKDSRIEVELSSSTLTVISGSSEDVVITIRVPPNMDPGLYVFTVQAQSQDLTVEMRSVPLDFLVISVFPLSDFEALEYTDPFNDDYTFYFEAQAKDGSSPKSSGKVGLMPGIDIVAMDAAFDWEARKVTVTVTLSETLVDDAETFYYVYFVTEEHAQGGVLLRPDRYEGPSPLDLSFNGSSGVLVWWEYHDGKARVVDAGDVPGANPIPTDLTVQVDGDTIVFTVSDEALRMGVVPGSGFGLYAFVHTLEDGEGWTRITWDSAGLGAASAPGEFRIEAEETQVTFPLALIAIVVAIVVLIVLFLGREKYLG